MLTREDNERVTRVGPGTPMGNLMRQYWVPALLSRELPSADSDPVRVLLLGEQLIAFRDTNGMVGLVQNNCPHRGASLFFGRNEESGLRCVYHGWKFNAAGECVDMPNEPAESDFKSRVRAVAYPTQERGGIVWAYLGPRTTPPPLPDLEANMLPDGQGVVQAVLRDCNWLQALEGDIDTSHLAFLHHGSKTTSDYREGTFAYYAVKDRAPRYQVVDTEYGAMYAAYRPAGEGQDYWRYAQFLFPFYVMISERRDGPPDLDPRVGTDGRRACNVLLHAPREHVLAAGPAAARGRSVRGSCAECGRGGARDPDADAAQLFGLAGQVPPGANRGE
jgi:phenylpropionate dioxygenase-like ring-hydroxylating dioxygenase large terminal subunit